MRGRPSPGIGRKTHSTIRESLSSISRVIRGQFTKPWCITGVAFIAVCAASLIVGVATTRATTSTKPLRVQKSLTARIDSATGYVTASGHITVNGKVAPTAAPSYEITRRDASGNTCGLHTTGAGPRVKLPIPGDFSVTATLRTKTKYDGRYLSISKTASADIGGDKMECAALGAPPTPSSICDWGTPPANPDPSQTYCGLAVTGRPAWTTAITMSGNAVSAGEIADPNGFCQEKPVPVKGVWLGSSVSDMEWDCTDSMAVIPEVSIWLTHPGSDQKCSDAAVVGGQLKSFVVPPSWGGTLYVTWRIMIGAGRNYFGYEYENASFSLSGTQDGCSQLGPGPRG